MRLPLVIVCLFSGVLSAADPQLMNLVMPDAKLLAGINVGQAKGSPFGQYLLAQAPANDQGLQQLINTTGFDPRRDLQEVLLASPGQPGTHKGLALVRGNFDIAKILEAVRGKGQTPQLYQGVQIISGPHNTQVLAFLDSSLAVAGDADLVRAAIDRRSAPASLDPVMVAKANSLSASQAAWFVSLAPASTLPHQVPPGNPAGPQANVLQKIQQASGGVQLGANVTLSGEAVSATSQDATALADVIRFFASMAQYQSQSQSQNAGQPQSQAAALLQNLDVKTSANVTTVSLSIPESQVEQLVQNAHRHPAGRERVSPAPRRQQP